MAENFMRAYAVISLLITVVGLGAMYAAPPPSMKVDRDGVPHFTPQVMHPETGEGVPMNTLIKHYRGD